MMREKTKYIHYGCATFEKELFVDIANIPLNNKPLGGLWASAVNAAYRWEDWCASTNYSECNAENSFTFTLADNAKVLYINSADDLKGLPVAQNDIDDFEIFSWTLLDFKKLADIYDAIEVNISNDRELYYTLYGWDCDSILIMNPDIIQVIK